MFPLDDNLDFKVTMESDASSVLDDDPFHILVLGNWSGRLNGSKIEEFKLESRLFEIDRDNFDEVLTKLHPALDLDLDGDGQSFVSLQFTAIDDFHPDNIFEQVSVFSDLRNLRERLLKSDNFDKAASEVRSWFETEAADNTNQIQQSVKTHSSSSQLLDDILSKPEQKFSSESVQIPETTGLNSLISKLVAPFLVKTDEKEQSKLVSAVDVAISGLMRKILHHPKFKELESAWRGLYFLVRGVETDLKLKIFLFDISQTELCSTLKFPDVFLKTELFNTLENSNNWALICGNYSFQIKVDDIATLIRIAKISNSIGAPFVSYLDIQGIESKSFTGNIEFNNSIFDHSTRESKLWSTIREIPEAESIGLLIQRLLIRLPYGSATEPTEKISFEEFSSDSVNHESYLWTNPCFAVALLMAQSFSVYGWQLENKFYQEIEGLPTLVFGNRGTGKIIPSSEFVLTERLYENILQLGFIPLINYSDNDRIRLAQLQSIALPKKPLKGKWN